MRHDLDQFGLAVTGKFGGTDVTFAHLATVFDQSDGKAHSRIRLLIARRAIAVCRDLGVIKLGDVFAQIGMRRQAIVTAIKLCDRKGNAFSGLRIERPFGKRPIQTKIALKGGRAVCRQAKQVRNRTKHLVHTFKKRLGSFRCGIDRSRQGNTGH